MLSSRAELLSKREQRGNFYFAESSKESHCKTRLELATPALTGNAISLSFWGQGCALPTKLLDNRNKTKKDS